MSQSSLPSFECCPAPLPPFILNCIVLFVQGYITAAGSLGRILFPVAFSFLSHSGVLWVAAILSFMTSIWLVFHYWCACCRCRSKVDATTAEQKSSLLPSSIFELGGTGSGNGSLPDPDESLSNIEISPVQRNRATSRSSLLHSTSPRGRQQLEMQDFRSTSPGLSPPDALAGHPPSAV